ncbi:hypothetical protein HU200_044372 [Digitaria exilis]|uniref:Uncharacterized protein n=1 Tax=Digitaria exilis TaxID=1010633 RepID=A0A835B1Y0_9POAL|nr:hypothetical protein HU200_044372 [Digitaria exilis]
MLPIWAHRDRITFSVLAQFSSTFLEKGRTMNTQVVGGFAIPAASLASFDAVSVIFWVPSPTTGSSSSSQAAHRQCPWPLGAAALRPGPFPLVMVMGRGGAGRDGGSLAMAQRRRRGGEVAMAMSHPVAGATVLSGGAPAWVACVGQTEFFYNEAPRSMRSLCSALALLHGGARELPELARGDGGGVADERGAASLGGYLTTSTTATSTASSGSSRR